MLPMFPPIPGLFGAGLQRSVFEFLWGFTFQEGLFLEKTLPCAREKGPFNPQGIFRLSRFKFPFPFSPIPFP